MLLGLTVILSAFICLTANGENAPHRDAFIFIEERPAFTSEDRTARTRVIYLNDRGKVQHYTCEDDKIKTFAESALNVADCFKTLSAISLKSLPTGPAPADEKQPPAQAGPSHTCLILRKASGAEYSWEGTTSLVPAELGKLAEKARALAAQARPVTAGVFVRADLMSTQRRDECRAMRLLHQVQNIEDLHPVLQEALTRPFCLVPIPPHANPFAALAVKGEPDQLQLIFNETGYELSRYSLGPPS